MAERFRDLVAPTGVDIGARTTPSGSPEAANQLASTFANFSRQAHAVGSTIRSNVGAKEGTEAGQEGTPEFRRGVRALTAYGRAYNSSALRSYAIRQEQDLAVQAARIEAEAGTDPEVFGKAMEAVRKATIEEAPAEARSILEQIYAQRTAQGLARINTKLVADLRAEDQQLVEDEVERLTSEIAELMVTDPTGEELSLKETQLEMLIQSAENDSTITKGQAGAIRRAAAKRVRHEAVLEQFRGELDAADGDPIGFIEDLKELNRVNEDLTPKEEQQLVNALFQEMNERSRLENAQASEDNALRAAIMEAGEREATVGVFRGELGVSDIARMVDNMQLEPSVGRTLVNEIQSQAAGGGITSDPQTLATFEANLLSLTEEEIWTAPDLSWEDRADLLEKRREQAAGWRSEPRAKEGYQRIERELGLQAGVPLRALDESEIKALDNAKTEYFNQMELVPPEEREAKAITVAESVINNVLRSNITQQIRETEKELEAARAVDTSEMDDRELRLHKDAIKEGEEELQQLRNQLRGGGAQ
jgi:hypothetical protein